MEQAVLHSAVLKAMEDFNAASLSVCVWDGENEFCDAAGMSDIQRGLTASPDTLYSIGSSTKAFVAAALCILAGEGRLSLDEPVKTYLPWFKMSDPYVTEHLTIRDALCHRSGMPRHDMTLDLNPELLPREMVERLAWLPAAFPLRYRFQYQNHMYVLATVLVETISGMPWGDFIRRRILQPLQMNSTYIYGDEISDDDTRKSAPYDGENHVFHRVPRQYLRQAAGAGSVYSTAPDMMKWLRFQLYGDPSILPDELRREAQAPQMLIRAGEVLDGRLPGVSSTAYGLGWFVYSYHGHVMVHHGGAMNGYRSMQLFLPDAGIAVSALTNSNEGDAVNALGYSMTDAMLGLPQYDWNPCWKKLYAPARAPREVKRQPDRTELHNAADYAGSYFDPGYGKLQFAAENGGVYLCLGDKRLPLYHGSGDRFDLLLDEISPVFPVTFSRDESGTVSAVDIPFELQLPDIPVHFLRQE